MKTRVFRVFVLSPPPRTVAFTAPAMLLAASVLSPIALAQSEAMRRQTERSNQQHRIHEQANEDARRGGSSSREGTSGRVPYEYDKNALILPMAVAYSDRGHVGVYGVSARMFEGVEDSVLTTWSAMRLRRHWPTGLDARATPFRSNRSGLFNITMRLMASISAVMENPSFAF